MNRVSTEPGAIQAAQYAELDCICNVETLCRARMGKTD